MKGTGHIKLIAAALLLTLSGAAQRGTYAKFDGSGEIIGLFNLSGRDGYCTNPQQFSGTVRNVKGELRGPIIHFSFLLVSRERSRVVGFSLKSDVVTRADIEKLLTSDGKTRLAVTACQTGRVWTAQAITRQ